MFLSKRSLSLLQYHYYCIIMVFTTTLWMQTIFWLNPDTGTFEGQTLDALQSLFNRRFSFYIFSHNKIWNLTINTYKCRFIWQAFKCRYTCVFKGWFGYNIKMILPPVCSSIAHGVRTHHRIVRYGSKSLSRERLPSSKLFSVPRDYDSTGEETWEIWSKFIM